MIQQVLVSVWNSFLSYLPGIVGAILVLIIGFILGKVIGRIIKEILVRVKIDRYVREGKRLGFKISDVGTVIVRWLIYIAFIWQAAIILNIAAIIAIMESIIGLLAGLIAAAIIIIAGYSLGIYIKDQIVASKTAHADLIGKVIFFFIVYISVAIGLQSVPGIEAILLGQILLVIIASLGLGLAIAVGLGLKDTVAQMGKEYVKKYRRMKK